MDELLVFNKKSKCNFCGTRKNNRLAYGPIYKLENIKAHYYCVLLSNRLIQNGNDDEGILGFLLTDILEELERTADILCFYCNKGTATIRCASIRCKKSFHLPCGLQNGSLHQFTDKFKSFCHVHRPLQVIPSHILKEAYKTDVVCCICHNAINIKNRKDNLWAPCCIRTWYHRCCVQKFALSSGYFFRCATCNDVQKFNKWMQRFGIFVPQQDASWELVPQAFEELLFRYNKCDAENCKCPQGRIKNTENTMWEIVLCGSCGSQGIHVACGNLKFIKPEWECPVCQNVANKVKMSDSFKAREGSPQKLKLTEICQKRLRDSDDLENAVLDKRKKCRRNGEEVEKEAENEIDVEIVDEVLKAKDDTLAGKVDCLEKCADVKVKSRQKANFQEVRSCKLAVIEICKQKLNDVGSKMRQPVIELIDIADSDEESESDGEIQIIKY